MVLIQITKEFSIYQSVILEKHFYKNEPPFKIITGNSSKMREKVIIYLSKNDHKFMSGDLYNQGYIQVL